MRKRYHDFDMRRLIVVVIALFWQSIVAQTISVSPNGTNAVKLSELSASTPPSSTFSAIRARTSAPVRQLHIPQISKTVGVAVSIIESQSYSTQHAMDTVWALAAHLLGYTPTIRPQTALDDTAFFSQTDVLVISSGVIDLPANRAKTILQFIRSGKPVYLQGEYLSTYATNMWFDALVDSLGGAFTPGGTVSGDLAPMAVLGTLSTTPNSIASLAYFWYGVSGVGDGLTCIPFLSHQDNYFGFVFTPPNPAYGKVIMTTDQDWVNNYSASGGFPLIENILAYLSNGTQGTAPVITVSPSSFDVTLSQGDSTTRTLTIGNAGNANLKWSFSNLSQTELAVHPAAQIQRAKSAAEVRRVEERKTEKQRFAKLKKGSTTELNTKTVSMQQVMRRGSPIAAMGATDLFPTAEFFAQFPDYSGNYHPMSIAFDGTYYWVVGGGGGSGDVAQLNKDFSLVTTKNVDLDCRSIFYNPGDGKVYIKGYTSNSLYRLHTTSFDGTFELVFNNIFQDPQTKVVITEDGQFMYDQLGGNVRKYRFSDGAIVKTFSLALQHTLNWPREYLLATSGPYLLSVAGGTVYAYDTTSGAFHSSSSLPTSDWFEWSMSYSNGLFFITNTAEDTWFAYRIDHGNQLNWMTANPDSGLISPGSSQDVTVKFTAKYFGPGNYSDTIRILSNDAINNPKNVPVALSVTGGTGPIITVSPSSFDVSLQSGDSTTRTLTIGNAGNADLTWNTQSTVLSEYVSVQYAASQSRAFSISMDKRSNSIPLSSKGHPSTQNASSKSVQYNTRRSGPVGGGVLIIGDGSTELSIDSILAVQGISSTIVSMDYAYLGNNPSPTGYGAVILCDGLGYESGMPTSGQQALVDYVQAGGRLIITEWIAFEISNGRYATLEPLVPVLRNTGRDGTETYTVAALGPITQGIDPFFSVTSGSNVGTARFGTVLVHGSGSGDAVVLSNAGAGRVIQFATAGNWSNHTPFSEPNMRKMLLNSIGLSLGFTSLSPTSGTITPGSSQIVTVKMNAKDMIPGNYSDTISITNNDPTNNPKKVPVALSVTGGTGPIITVSPSSFNVSLQSGDSTTRLMTIGNSGPGDLTYSITNKSTSPILDLVVNNVRTSAHGTKDVIKNRSVSGTKLEKYGKMVGDLVSDRKPDNSGSVPGSNRKYVYPEDATRLIGENILAYGLGSTEVDRFRGLGAVVDVLSDPSLLPSVINNYNVFYVAYTTISNLSSYASTVSNYVWSGGGFVVQQPNTLGPVAIMPSGFEVSVDSIFYSNPTDLVFRPSAANHPITQGLTPDDLSGNFDIIHESHLGTSFVVLATQRTDASTIALAAGAYGSGRIVLHTGNFSTGSMKPGSDVYISQMLEWVSSSSPQWLSENPISGTIGAGASVNVVVTFDAAALSAGIYRDTIVISSNDPSNNQKNVPVLLTVGGGATIISVVPDSAFQGQTLPVTITGQNTSFRVFQGSSTSDANHVWFSQGSSTINASTVTVSSATGLTANFSIPGDALTGLWDVHVEQPADKGTVTLHEGFTINHSIAEIPTPHIRFVRDVPNDNGKQVFVRWSVDHPAVSSGIARFGVWRKDSVWTFLKDSVLTVNDTLYQFVAPTLFDSTKVSGIHYSVFRITAHSVNPQHFSMSLPDSGYSVDNLSPSVPKGIRGTIQSSGGTIAVLLQWNSVPEKDLRYYAVYRSETQDFAKVDSSTFIGASADTTYRDSTVVRGKRYYYRVVAFDWSGNRSAPSTQLALTVTSVDRVGIEVPKEFSVEQNYPNPFNPSTIIRYGVPAHSRVKIDVFNAIGQLVASLLDGEREAGYYEAEWRASVASGIYIYRIEAIALDNPNNAFVQVKKMVLLK